VPDHLAAIARPPRVDDTPTLFEVEDAPTHGDYWWGLPEFNMVDASPSRRVVVNFLTDDDAREFADRLQVKLSARSDSLWYPPQTRLRPKEYVWRGSPSPTRHPVYIPSKGRAEVETTGGLLRRAGVEPWWVVEPQDAAEYRAKYGERVLVLPFANLGQGSIPARNWIWEHAKAHGHKWHWIIDDNILGFWRANANRRLVVESSSAPLRVVEDFAERYDNLAFAGLAADDFAPDRQKFDPVTWNTRIYSVTLIRTDLAYRWRGKYNEDTDLCLRALKDGWATALFRSMLMKKAHTAKGDGTGGMKGGNTDHVYNSGDHRRVFAESLRAQHPDVTTVAWKFDRWHHQVNYAPFRNNDPRLRPDVTPTRAVDNYGLQLVRTTEPAGE